MRKLSGNLVTMAAMMTDCQQATRNRRASGNLSRREGESSQKDKLGARLNIGAVSPTLVPMKAVVVPCIVLGSTALSTAIIVVVSVLMLA